MCDRKNLLSSADSLSSTEETNDSSLPVELNKNNDTSKWKAIKVTYAIMFFTSVSYSIQMPSLWPYMNIIDETYSKEFLGWVVAVYSIGQLCACPLFSYISGKTGCFKSILILSAVIAGVGNYLYSIIVDIDGKSARTISLLASRIIIGIAGANIAPVRLFLILVTTEEERIGPMSILSACQGLGFIIGPGLQAAFVPMGYPGILKERFFRVNMYTASGIFGVLSNFVILVLLIFCFQSTAVKKKEGFTIQTSESMGSNKKYEIIRKVDKTFINDYFSAVFMLLAFFICMMSLAVLETSTTPITMDNFGWSRSHATLVNSIILATSGVCSIGIFISLRFIVKIIREKIVFITGFVLILLSAVYMIPMGNGKIPIQPNATGLNMTESSPGGCNLQQQPWCEHVSALEYWQYGLSLALFTLGYPTANVLSYVIFSRLVDPSAQSLWMGLLTASGSSARVIGPIFISKLYETSGTQIAFGSWSAIILLFLCFTPLLLWKLSKTETLRDPASN